MADRAKNPAALLFCGALLALEPRISAAQEVAAEGAGVVLVPSAPPALTPASAPPLSMPLAVPAPAPAAAIAVPSQGLWAAAAPVPAAASALTDASGAAAPAASAAPRVHAAAASGAQASARAADAAPDRASLARFFDGESPLELPPRRRPILERLIAPLVSAWPQGTASRLRLRAAHDRGADRAGAGLRPSPRDFADAREAYRREKVELLDEQGRGERAARARSLKADDLFNSLQGFRGSLAELVEKEAFRSTTVYRQPNGYDALTNWWSSVRIAGKRSESPLARLYAKRYGLENLERTVHWQRRIGTDPMAPEGIRVALNQARVDGRLVDLSLEVIARGEGTEEWEAFFYVKKDGRWVASETFDGMPVKESCMRCHSALATSPRAGSVAAARLTPYPYKKPGFFRNYPTAVRRVLHEEVGIPADD